MLWQDMIQEQIAFFERWMQKGLADDIQITDDAGRISVADNAEQVRIAEVADDVMVMYAGKVVETGFAGISLPKSKREENRIMN